MHVDVAALGIDQLSVGQRIELIEMIWDSLPEQVDAAELPPSHLAELVRRRADADANPGVGKPWRQVLDALGSKS